MQGFYGAVTFRKILDKVVFLHLAYCMFSHYKHVLGLIAKRLRGKPGDDIEAIIAFGSRVRGNHTDSSDFDLLVVAKGLTPARRSEIVDIIFDIEMEHEMSFSPIIRDSESFAKEREHNTPFYQNIRREGVPI
jgi:predicted nucleotidyltransferase